MQKLALRSVEPDAASEGIPSCKALGPILDHIGDKWTVVVAGALLRGPVCFDALQSHAWGLSSYAVRDTARPRAR